MGQAVCSSMLAPIFRLGNHLTHFISHHCFCIPRLVWMGDESRRLHHLENNGLGPLYLFIIIILKKYGKQKEILFKFK